MSTDTSPYEEAVARFNRIAENHAGIVKCAQGVIDWANAEYDAAQDNLRQYESQPGIPLPQYREQAAGAPEPARPYAGTNDIGLMEPPDGAIGILQRVRDRLLALPGDNSSEGDAAA